MSGLIGVVTNPNAGKNRRRGGDRKGQLQRAVGRRGLVRQTRDVEHLRQTLHEFFEAGCDHWVADGGDGTLHWLLSVGWQVACERAGQGEARLPRIVPANGGSVDFVAHKAGIRGGAPDVLRELSTRLDRGQGPELIELDTIRMQGRYRDPQEDGRDFDRLGFASAIGGVAQRFFEKLYALGPVDAKSIVSTLASSVGGVVATSTPRPLKKLVPQWLQTFGDEIFEPTYATVQLDGQPLPYRDFASLQVGSIDINLGGVVRAFRHAATPGVMHAQAISMSRWGVAANLPNIVMGTKIWGDKVYDGPVRHLRAEAPAGRVLDPVIDGELFFGLCELTVEAGPRLEIPAVGQTN